MNGGDALGGHKADSREENVWTGPCLIDNADDLIHRNLNGTPNTRLATPHLKSVLITTLQLVVTLLGQGLTRMALMINGSG